MHPLKYNFIYAVLVSMLFNGCAPTKKHDFYELNCYAYENEHKYIFRSNDEYVFISKSNMEIRETPTVIIDFLNSNQLNRGTSSKFNIDASRGNKLVDEHLYRLII